MINTREINGDYLEIAYIKKSDLNRSLFFMIELEIILKHLLMLHSLYEQQLHLHQIIFVLRHLI